MSRNTGCVTVYLFDDNRLHVEEVGVVSDEDLAKEVRDYLEEQKAR
ncbi:MAG: hypothetical protein GWN39_17090 [Thermoplasmata archaeon]|nr:hypothetical protein [Thermoplasmata archaeon]NIT79191.1 hypothetical protein [Thermoplasmata archaeon]NIU50688.1 hypothetical protein [Thermoplasmata archaeon]NIV80412.1 hypothetical protein [Thermoplasmata archaeon]NIY05559.1 hypothetical protein [Thermoplasmata archaeon]